jgi:hypothetical protein
MPRFVIHYHEMPPQGDRASHWDLMLERAGVLRTWELAEAPTADRPVAARSLPDHRLAYLDYEGPISGDRGVVTRWDQGEHLIERESESELVLELIGERLRGTIRLELVAES